MEYPEFFSVVKLESDNLSILGLPGSYCLRYGMPLTSEYRLLLLMEQSVPGTKFAVKFVVKIAVKFAVHFFGEHQI